MGFIDQGIPTRTGPPAPLPRQPGEGDLAVDPATAPPPEHRVNWLFSGVMLGAASWMLVLGVVFAAVGNWIIAGVLLGGMALCLLAIWRAGRRAARERGRGRHRADGGSAVT